MSNTKASLRVVASRAIDTRFWAWTVSLLTLCLLAACIPDLGQPLQLTDASDTDASAEPDSSVPPDSGPRDAGGPTDAGDLFAIGERIFLVQAGPADRGGGCKQCHGATAGGDVGIGPNIRGRNLATVTFALRDVTEMDFIRLTPTEIEAVVVYLQWLKDTYG